MVLASRLGFRPPAGRLAGILVALYPILWMYPVGLGSENTFILLTLSGLLLVLEAKDRRSDLWAVAAGLNLGLATLTRGGLVLFLGLAVVWLARTSGWRRSAILAAAASALLLPWAVRNSLLLGRPAFVENSMGYNLFVGYHPQGDGGFVASVAVLPTRFLEDGARDAWSLDQATGFIRDDPLRAASLIPRRIAYLAGFETRELAFFYSNGFFGPIPAPVLAALWLILVVPWASIALLSGFGLASADLPTARNLSLLLIGATVVVYAPILAEPRFHLPLVPVLSAYAAAVMTEPARLLPNRGPRSKTAYAAACAVAVVLLLLWAWDPAGQVENLVRLLAPGGHELRLSY